MNTDKTPTVIDFAEGVDAEGRKLAVVYRCRVAWDELQPTELPARADYYPGDGGLSPARPRYSLAELLAGMKPGDMPCAEGWSDARPAGREAW